MNQSLTIRKRGQNPVTVKVGNYYKASFATKWVSGTIIFKLRYIDDHQKSVTYLFAEDNRVINLKTGELKNTHAVCDNINGAALNVANIKEITDASVEESRSLRTYLVQKAMDQDETQHIALIADRSHLLNMHQQGYSLF